MHQVQEPAAHTRGIARYTRTLTRAVALLVAVSFAVVGIAAPSSAHHTDITGSVACATGGGWAVTWQVTNSETTTETITASNRPVVPVGTTLSNRQTKTFTETVTTKPSSPLTLELSGSWPNGNTAKNSGSIAVDKFTTNCAVKTVQPPTVPVTDACGPGNAVYGTVPAGPWTSVVNPNGSLVITTQPGYVFPNGQTSITYPVPTDSNTPCPVGAPTVPVIDACGPGNAVYGTVPTGNWTSVVNPDGSLVITALPGYVFPNGQTSITLPVPTDSNTPCPVTVTPPTQPPVVPVVEVLPAEVLVVRANARQIDKCGRASDLFRVARSKGVVYRANGKTVREGKWVRAKQRTVTIRAFAESDSYALRGKQVWKMTFKTKPCGQAPEIAPNTGS